MASNCRTREGKGARSPADHGWAACSGITTAKQLAVEIQFSMNAGEKLYPDVGEKPF